MDLEASLTASAEAVERSSRSEPGYRLLVVYPSTTHSTRPPATTGYGSPSSVSHGATRATRSWISLSETRRSFDFSGNSRFCRTV